MTRLLPCLVILWISGILGLICSEIHINNSYSLSHLSSTAAPSNSPSASLSTSTPISSPRPSWGQPDVIFSELNSSQPSLPSHSISLTWKDRLLETWEETQTYWEWTKAWWMGRVAFVKIKINLLLDKAILSTQPLLWNEIHSVLERTVNETVNVDEIGRKKNPFSFRFSFLFLH